jgi:hypothetical protein
MSNIFAPISIVDLDRATGETVTMDRELLMLMVMMVLNSIQIVLQLDGQGRKLKMQNSFSHHHRARCVDYTSIFVECRLTSTEFYPFSSHTLTTWMCYKFYDESSQSSREGEQTTNERRTSFCR